MATLTADQKIYKYHVTNLRSIKTAIQNTALSARRAISEENKPATTSFISLYSFLIGAWAENRLKKLLYEKGCLSKDVRQRILTIDSQLERWSKAVEIAVRKHYGVPHSALNNSNLPFSVFARFSVLNEIIQIDLKQIIEIRNKLAHGQWVYPFNSDESGIESVKYNFLQNENLLSLQFRFNMISSLADIIHDLIVSVPTFERDFDKHFRMISNIRSNLKNRKYNDYRNLLISKYKNGIKKRKLNRL